MILAPHRGIMALLTVLLSSSIAMARPARSSVKPTETNVKYGKHERNTMDFWKAESSKPTPILIYFHGGAFKVGDKSAVYRNIDIKAYLAKGVSCASVNYPFLKHKNNNYLAIMKECEDAVEFIRKNARKWNVDVDRIASSGTSAGALITEWIGYQTDSISAMGVLLQPKGTLLLAAPHVKADSPPLFIYQSSPESDAVHHPKYARTMKSVCDAKGVRCVLWGTGSNGITKLPAGKDHKSEMMTFFLECWGIESGKGSK